MLMYNSKKKSHRGLPTEKKLKPYGLKLKSLRSAARIRMNHKKIRELSDRASSENSLRYRASSAAWHTKVHPVERIQAVEKDQNQVTLDKSGIFVILPKPEKHMILVEHYNNAVNLLGIIAGANSRNIYGSILENVWVTEMSHAANLGKELARSELSIKFGFKYV